jgi:hypothetical protein
VTSWTWTAQYYFVGLLSMDNHKIWPIASHMSPEIGKISLSIPCFFFHPKIEFYLPKIRFSFTDFFKGIDVYFQPFKSSVRIYRIFFKGINENSEGEKEKQKMGRKIFVDHVGFLIQCWTYM